MTAALPPQRDRGGSKTGESGGGDLDYLALATQLQEDGDTVAAAVVLRHGLSAALRNGEPFTEETVGTYARISAALTSLLTQSGAPADALRVAAELRSRLRELGYPGSELLILANLIGVHLALGDPAAAGECAMAAILLFRKGARRSLPDFPVPDARGLEEAILKVAHAAYYSAEDYELSAMMTELAIELNPDSASGFWLLAFSRLRLEQFDIADVAFDQAIRLEPEAASRAALHTGKAAVLQGDGRVDEAIASMTQAITLVAGKPLYFINRGKLNSAAGNHAQAIADFRQAIRLAAQVAARETGTRGEFRSEADYQRDMPAADVHDLASVLRMAELWKAGRTKDALRAGRALAVHGSDQPTRSEAQYHLGVWYLELSELESATRAFTAVIDAGIFLAQALLGRARCRIALGRVDDALADLDAVCGQDDDRHDPRGAAVLLSGLLERHPELIRARLVMGHALLEAWRPAEAIRELDKVIDEEPGNWQALRWRGTCRVTHSGPGEGTQEVSYDEAWNDGLSFDRIWLALEDLVAAAKAAPKETPLPELPWLVERVLLIDEFEGPLIRTASLRSGLGHSLAEVVPGLRDAFYHFEAVLQARVRRDWAACVDALAEYRAAAAAAELPILVAWADLLTADVLLRQFELQQALDHLAIVELALPALGHLPGRPFTEGQAVASTEAEWDVRNTGGQANAGTQEINVDFDHLEFSATVISRFVSMYGLIKAEATARLGNPVQALRYIRDLPSVVADAAAGRNTSRALAVVRLLRDGGEYSQALALIDALRPHLPDGFERERLVLYEATTCDLMGMPQQAEEILEAEVARARSGELELAWAAAANLASALLGKDDGRALSVLDEFRPPEGESVYALSDWHAIRGQALLRLYRYGEALVEFTTSLDLRDQVRGGLRAEDARISWQSERLGVVELAVDSALSAGDAATALELAERGKARAFVDQLGLGHPQVTPEAAEIATAIDQVQRRRHLLRRLVQAVSPEPDGTVPEELAIMLRELDVLGISLRRDTPVTVERAYRLLYGTGTQMQDLEALFQEASLEGRASVAGMVASAPAIRSLLTPSSTADRVLLAEYFTLGDDIVVFLVDSGGIGARQVAVSESAARAVTQSWLAAVSQGRTPDTTGPDGLDTLSLLIEPVLDACEPGDLVWFVPHGILHYLPLHAIPIGGMRLIERNPVVYAPSASVLAQCRARRGDRPRQWCSALVLGDSGGNLPHAREEARVVADLLGVSALVGEAAVKPLLSALREPRADGPDVIHLACHGVFDADRPLRSGIVLALPPGRHPDEAILTAEEVYGLQLTAGLVTLSACDSGQSVSAPGEELIGLTRAFMSAGAATLLVSLWPVDDLSTGLLMEAFYTRLLGADGRPAVQPAQALRDAQVRLMTMTAGEAVGLVSDQIARTTDSLDLLYRKLDLARLRIVAGDLSAAEGLYSEIRHELAGRPGPLADLVDQRLRLIRFKQEAATPVDYDVRPFGHPRYWSAFALVGDWR